MGLSIKIVAQSAMDRYYGEYKASVQFFDLDDFVLGCGMAWAAAAQRMYLMMYAELKGEKDDSIVSFDPTMLNTQVLTVDKKDGRLFAKYKYPVMTFAFTNQSIGVQSVTVVSPSGNYGASLERYSEQAAWQMNYIPYVNRLFYSPRHDGIDIIKKGACNVNEVSVSYVPAISPNGEDYYIPEGMSDEIMAECITLVREGRLPVIKKANDQNPNMVMETEINKQELK
jgi:hypothetical protein